MSTPPTSCTPSTTRRAPTPCPSLNADAKFDCALLICTCLCVSDKPGITQVRSMQRNAVWKSMVVSARHILYADVILCMLTGTFCGTVAFATCDVNTGF